MEYEFNLLAQETNYRTLIRLRNKREPLREELEFAQACLYACNTNSDKVWEDFKKIASDEKSLHDNLMPKTFSLNLQPEYKQMFIDYVMSKEKEEESLSSRLRVWNIQAFYYYALFVFYALDENMADIVDRMNNPKKYRIEEVEIEEDETEADSEPVERSPIQPYVSKEGWRAIKYLQTPP